MLCVVHAFSSVPFSVACHYHILKLLNQNVYW